MNTNSDTDSLGKIFSHQEGFTYVYDTALTDQDLQAIGHVASMWSVLEGTVELGIWGFSGLTRDQGMPLTAHVGIRQRLDTIVMAGHRKLPDDTSKDELVKLSKHIDGLRDRRNNIIHARWSRDAVPLNYRRKKKGTWAVSLGPTKYHEQDIKALGKDIFSATARLHAFLALHDALPQDSRP